jgi:predicted aminopeptidase
VGTRRPERVERVRIARVVGLRPGLSSTGPRRLLLVLLLPAATLLGGCSLGYYAQAVHGHLDLVQRARPVPDWLADPATPEALRERLVLTQQLRDFAVRELALPDNASYRRYAALGRPAVVWNVVAAPELSLQLKTWCYPLMGCAGYRGYFAREPAEALARKLREHGWETSVYGVPAYSTLGWTNWVGGDPLLDTFVSWGEGELAGLLFHELAHQVVYVADDTSFNESYATAVERLGVRRWLAQPGREAARQAYEAGEARRRDFRVLARAARQELQALYAGAGDEASKRAGKQAALARLRDRHAQLKAGTWAGYTGYDGWFARVNNAALAVQGAYDDLVPAFERLFDDEGRDFVRFHAAVQRLVALPKAERRARLLVEPTMRPAARAPDAPRACRPGEPPCPT